MKNILNFFPKPSTREPVLKETNVVLKSQNADLLQTQRIHLHWRCPKRETRGRGKKAGKRNLEDRNRPAPSGTVPPAMPRLYKIRDASPCMPSPRLPPFARSSSPIKAHPGKRNDHLSKIGIEIEDLDIFPQGLILAILNIAKGRRMRPAELHNI